MNLALLCDAHHAGRYKITHDTTAPGHLRLHLPDGTPIPTSPSHHA